MMNLSGVCKVGIGPTGGETFTVTCFACGMPSSKEWAQRVRSRPYQSTHHHHQEPFFPLLLDMRPVPHGAIVMEDGSTYLCAFCHALLESQWNNYEMKSEHIPASERTYNVHKFICAVCAVQTYRKRVRALPFQEFPFLVKQRQPGSITLGNNPLAVVCLDCSETLWAQSAEYDRWGLPVDKRHFNWMARPPPPEDSVEATVARLPSGETQLPRCPPTDPLVPPKTNEPTAMPEAIPPVRPSKPRSSCGSSRHDLSHPHPSVHSSSGMSRLSHQQPHNPSELSLSVSHSLEAAAPSRSSRKTSVGRAPISSPQLDLGGPHSQPPIVTVAPMSTQHTLTNTRKDSMSHIPSHQNKYDIVTVTQVGGPPPSTHRTSPGSALGHPSSSLYHQTPLFSPSGSYPGPFPWPASLSSRDGELPQGHPVTNFSHYGNNSVQSPESLPNPPTWPWIQPTSPELLRYQSYISSLQSRGLADSYYPAGVAMYPPSSTISSTATYLPPLYTQQSSIGSSSPPAHLAHASSSVGTASKHHQSMLQEHGVHRHHTTSHEHETQSPPQFSGSRNSRSTSPPNSQYHNLSKTQNVQSEEEARPYPRPTSSRSSSKSSSYSDETSSNEKSGKTDGGKHDPSGSDLSHSKSKKNMSRRTSPFSKPECSSKEKGGITTSSGKRVDLIHPKKRHWQPQTSVSESSSSLDKDQGVPPPERKRKLAVTSFPQSEHENVPMDFTVRRKFSTPNQPSSFTQTSQSSGKKDFESSSRDTAIDLSLPSSTTSPSPSSSFRSRTVSCPTSSKFSIAYLCKSETISPPCVPNISAEETSSSNRSSVIVTIPLNKDKTNEDEESSKIEDTEENPGTEVKALQDDEKASEIETEKTETEEDISSKSVNTVASNETLASSAPQDEDTTPKNDTAEPDNQSELDSHNAVLESSESKDEEFCEANSTDKKSPVVETQINMVTIGEIRLPPEDFVRTTIENYVSKEKEVDKMRQERLNEQLEFLSHLGLITPEKKKEFELEMLISRSEKNTIPPVKLRITSPPLATVDEELEQQLLQVAFDDPSLKHTSTDPEKSFFLKNLGLKPCTKNEKSRREVGWRLILTERLLREKRNDRLRGVKRPWDTYNRVSKLLSVPKKIGRSATLNSNSECLTFLTLTLPKEVDEANGPRRNSSDLLTTVEANQNMIVNTTTAASGFLNEANDESSIVIKNGICINYPTYIPSYVLTAQSKELEKEESKKEDTIEQPKPVEILNVPSVNPMTSFPTSPPATAVGIERILRIPVVTSSSLIASRRRSSNSTLPSTTDDSDGEISSTEIELIDVKKEDPSQNQTQTTENENSHTVNRSTKNGPSSCQWSEVEGILKASTAQWEKTKKVMEKALRQTDYLQSKENKKLLEYGAVQFKAIRRHLKAQQADMKQTEKLFKGKEKEVIKKLRTLTKYSNSKETN